MKLRSLYSAAFAALALLATPLVSQAFVVGMPDNNDTITAIFGSGNPDSGWVSAEGGGAQTAFRFHERFTVNAGMTSAPNYTFNVGTEISLDFSFAAIGTAPDENELTDYVYMVYVDSDPSAAVNLGPGIPFTAFAADNSYGISTTGNGLGQEGPAFLAGATIGQNSQKVDWFGTGFTSAVPGDYVVAVTAAKAGSPGSVVAQSEGKLNVVAAVPEPSGTLLTGLAALGLMSKRKRSTK